MPNHCAHITKYYDHLLRQLENKNNYTTHYVEYEYLLDRYTDYLYLEFDP